MKMSAVRHAFSIDVDLSIHLKKWNDFCPGPHFIAMYASKIQIQTSLFSLGHPFLPYHGIFFQKTRRDNLNSTKLCAVCPFKSELHLSYLKDFDFKLN